MQRICKCTNERARRFKVLLQLTETDLATHPQIQEVLKPPPWIPANQSWPPKAARSWTDMTPPEFQRWVGILVYAGIVDLPRYEDYFLTDAMWGPVGGKLGAITMTRKRFDVIKAMLSTETPAEESKAHENGRIRKMGLLLELFRERCKAARRQPKRDLSLDEQTVGCKSRWTTHTFMNRHKPQGQGFRIYSINEVSTGYTLHFELDRHDAADVGKIRRIVLDLCRQLGPGEHDIYMDNLFTSVDTFDELKKMGHGACGTLSMKMKKHLPDEVLDTQALERDLPNRGDMFAMYRDDGMTVWVWHDSKVMRFLTTIHKDGKRGTLQRRESGVRGRVEVPAPECAIEYNLNMCATDKVSDECNLPDPSAPPFTTTDKSSFHLSKFDQMRMTHSTQRRSKKWWMPLFAWWIDAMCVNAYAIWREQFSEAQLKLRKHQRDAFQKLLAEQLLGINSKTVEDFMNTARNRRASTSSSEQRSAVNPFHPAADSPPGSICPAQLMDAFDKVFKGHEDMVDKRKRGECVYCKQIGVSSKKKGYKYTHNYCATCQAYVHPTCWIKFHRCQIVEAAGASQE